VPAAGSSGSKSMEFAGDTAKTMHLIAAYQVRWHKIYIVREEQLQAKMEKMASFLVTLSLHVHLCCCFSFLLHLPQRRGHEMAILDPLGLEEPTPIMDLDPATYGFDLAADWERPLNLEGAFVGNVKGLMGNADVNQVEHWRMMRVRVRTFLVLDS